MKKEVLRGYVWAISGLVEGFLILLWLWRCLTLKSFLRRRTEAELLQPGGESAPSQGDGENVQRCSFTNRESGSFGSSEPQLWLWITDSEEIVSFWNLPLFLCLILTLFSKKDFNGALTPPEEPRSWSWWPSGRSLTLMESNHSWNKHRIRFFRWNWRNQIWKSFFKHQSSYRPKMSIWFI